MTGYETLQKAVADAQKMLNDEKAKLVALQSDPSYIYYRAIFADPRVKNATDGWIATNGEFWQGADAKNNRNIAGQYITDWESKIDTQEYVIADAQKTLETATQTLVNYETNSPIGQQAAASQKDADSKRTLVVTTVIIGVVIVTVAFVIYYVRKSKKKKTE